MFILGPGSKLTFTGTHVAGWLVEGHVHDTEGTRWAHDMGQSRIFHIEDTIKNHDLIPLFQGMCA